jgi:hypothetical protein
MRTLILAAVCAAAATSAAMAQAGFNPGTVISNVYEDLEARGCDPSFGFSPNGCNYYRYAPGYRQNGGRRYGRVGGSQTTAATTR